MRDNDRRSSRRFLASLQSGDVLADRFQVLKILSEPFQSSWAETYACYDRMAHQIVVLKGIQARYAKGRAHEEFDAACAKWKAIGPHPNIVIPQDVARYGGRTFVVTEYVAGRERLGATLAQHIAGNVLDTGMSMALAVQICSGMAFVHERASKVNDFQGHGDLKPSNILISRSGIAKVTDWGLTRALRLCPVDIPAPERAQFAPRLFAKRGTLYGTPAYIPPERCGGDTGVDWRGDVYNFGCILFEMLTGRLLFSCRTLDECVKRHVMAEPEIPDMEESVRRIVLRCCEKDPNRRYSNFGELLQDLRDACVKIGVAAEIRVEESSEALVWSNRGDAFMEFGLFDKAIECYQRRLRHQPDSPAAYCDLAGAFMAAGKVEESIAKYKEALRLQPSHARAHLGLGVAMSRTGNLEAAIEEYRTVVRINPEHADAYYNLGNAYRAQGRLQDATLAYREATRLAPYDPDMYNNLGNALHALGKLQDAVAALKVAIELKPNYAEAHYNLGNVYRDLGWDDLAVSEYRKAINLAARFPEAHFNLAHVYHRQGKIAESAAEYKKTIEENPTDASAHFNLANLYHEQGKIDQAVEQYKATIAADPTYAEAHINLGNCYYMQGYVDLAIAEYNMALLASPSYPEVHYNLGNAYLSVGERQKAVLCLARFVQLVGDEPKYASLVAKATTQMRRLRK